MQVLNPQLDWKVGSTEVWKIAHTAFLPVFLHFHASLKPNIDFLNLLSIYLLICQVRKYVIKLYREVITSIFNNWRFK
jgi:hypothetical protein